MEVFTEVYCLDNYCDKLFCQDLYLNYALSFCLFTLSWFFSISNISFVNYVTLLYYVMVLFISCYDVK